VSIKILIYAAGACTLIAGILHLSLASNFIGFNLPVGIFLVAGIGQIFWTLPIVRSWGKIWNYVGIGGTIILIIIWIITRYPNIPITGRGPSCKFNRSNDRCASNSLHNSMCSYDRKR